MAKKRYVVMKKSGRSFTPTDAIYTGSSPSAAAAKVARKTGAKKIYLRETGQSNVREYNGSIKSQKLKSATAWAKKGSTVKVGKAKYIGIHKL